MPKKCTQCNAASNKPQSTKVKKIPLVVAECEAVRQHQIIMYLIYALMVVSVLLFGSNIAWLFFGGVI